MKKIVVVGKVVTHTNGHNVLKVGSECPFRYGRHFHRLNFTKFLEEMKGKKVKITLEELKNSRGRETK